jgi:hypothetical protein
MTRRADVVPGSRQGLSGPEHGSGVGPASAPNGQCVSTAWPLQSHLQLGALPTAVPCARLHARLVLAEWGLNALVDMVELLVSELVTNSVQASTGLVASRYQGRWRPGLPPVRHWLRSDRERVLIQVWDGNDQMPRRQELGPDAEHGRGLLLVESLSAEWGAFAPDRSGGKVVWAIADLLNEPGG